MIRNGCIDRLEGNTGYLNAEEDERIVPEKLVCNL